MFQVLTKRVMQGCVTWEIGGFPGDKPDAGKTSRKQQPVPFAAGATAAGSPLPAGLD